MHTATSSLRWALRHPLVMLLLTVVTVGTSVSLFIDRPKGFFPEQDTGRIAGTIQAEQDISFSGHERQSSNQVIGIIQSDPDVVYVAGFTGGGGGGGRRRTPGGSSSLCNPSMNEKATADRGHRAAAQEARPGTGCATYLQPVQDLRIGGRISNALYQYTLQWGQPAAISPPGRHGSCSAYGPCPPSSM